jgi:hypothetical protein
MKGEAGRHQADGLLANFATVIAHACDPVSAKWLSSKLGQKKKILYGGSSTRREGSTVWDCLFGDSGFSGNFNERYEPVLQDQEFMQGRTGGPLNDYFVDGIVIRSGVPFSDLESYQRVIFSQKG